MIFSYICWYILYILVCKPLLCLLLTLLSHVSFPLFRFFFRVLLNVCCLLVHLSLSLKCPVCLPPLFLQREKHASWCVAVLYFSGIWASSFPCSRFSEDGHSQPHVVSYSVYIHASLFLKSFTWQFYLENFSLLLPRVTDLSTPAVIP